MALNRPARHARGSTNVQPNVRRAHPSRSAPYGRVGASGGQQRLRDLEGIADNAKALAIDNHD